MAKEFLKNYPFTTIAIALISAIIIPSIITGKSIVINEAIVQAGWCISEDSICLLENFAWISFALLVLGLIIDTGVKSYKKYLFIGRPSPSLNKDIADLTEKTYEPKELKWVAIVYDKKNIFGDYLVTWAGIRVDDKLNCHKLTARLISVKRKTSNEDEEIDINKINPTGDPLRWNKDGNPCILNVILEGNETASFAFENERYSKYLQRGEYEIEIFITGIKLQQKVVKRINIRKPKHFYREHETGLEWL